MSRAEAGKLGWIKSQPVQLANRKKRREEYKLNPKQCLHCSKPLEFLKRKNKFCSHSCTATYNNNLRGHYRSKEKPCKNCSTITHKKSGYCSKKCYRIHHRAIKIQQIEQGLVSNRKTLRNYLIEKFGYNCFECSLNEWLGKHLPLELDHIDGNAGNNLPNNLRLLCPNCHSITPTWKAKNKGSGRKSRGLKLA